MLASCATPYQEIFLTGGVSGKLLTPETAQIEVKLNGFSSSTLLRPSTVLKAAEFTLENGFGHFEITLTVSGTSKPKATVVNGSIFKSKARLPKAITKIRMFRGPKPEGSAKHLHDAKQTISTIKPKLKG